MLHHEHIRILHGRSLLHKNVNSSSNMNVIKLFLQKKRHVMFSAD